MQKRLGQASFADVIATPAGSKSQGRLERIAALLDWSALEAILAPLCHRATGRPGYPPLVMFRALLLAQWYGLSDPGLEEALADRMSFRRFVGLSLQDRVPDETTFCRFRTALKDANLIETLAIEVNRQFERRGLVLKTGTIIDASVVEAAVRRPASGQGASPTDPDAAWLSHGRGPNRFGYKAHIAVDQGSGLIRRVLLTAASTHDSQPADALVMCDERAVYADRAYENKERRRALRSRGTKDRIMHKGQRNHPITAWQRVRNRLIAPIRSAVERVFGTWKRSYGFTRVRYIGQARNTVQLHLLAIAFNLRKAETLVG